MKTAEDYWFEHCIKTIGGGHIITEASFKHVVRLAQSENKHELDSLKKVYNDLAESHAKQVVKNNAFKTTIEEYKKSSIGYEMALDKLESELLKAKERFCQCIENDKTGSTSAMHCNHCGKIEQYETWLK